MTDESSNGLVLAMLLDGSGGARELGWEEVAAWSPDQGFLWIHLDYRGEQSQRWLREESGLDELIREALTAEEPRPRSLVHGNGLLTILRGINLNRGAAPDDMVSLRTWIEPSRALTLRHRRVSIPQDVRKELSENRGPRDAGELLVEVCERLTVPIGEAVTNLDDAVDGLEDEVLTAGSYELRSRIGHIRRQAIGLRRYLAPQRDVLGRLLSERVDWLDELDRQRVREIADRVMRQVEDLDSARDRATVVQEELNTRLSEQMNRTMYVLSIVAAIFLPLGLLTGLLGINVGGIPGTDSPWAFAIVCVLLFALAIAIGAVFRAKHWI